METRATRLHWRWQSVPLRVGQTAGRDSCWPGDVLVGWAASTGRAGHPVGRSPSPSHRPSRLLLGAVFPLAPPAWDSSPDGELPTPSTDGTPRCRRLPIAGGAAELPSAHRGEGVGRGLASSARDCTHPARFGPATDCSLRRACPSTSVSAWTSAINPDGPRNCLLGPHGPTTPCGGGVGIGSPHWPDAMSCPRGVGRPSWHSATKKWGRRNTPHHSTTSEAYRRVRQKGIVE